MNFVTGDEVNIYSENSEDESVDRHRTATCPNIITPKITNPDLNISPTQEPQESAINVTKVQVQSLKKKLFGKILVFKSYSIDEILSCMYEIKACKINDNVQKPQTEKSQDFILLRERIKYLEVENKFLQDDIFHKEKLIDKLLEN